MRLSGALLLAGLLSIFGGSSKTAQLSNLEVELVESRLEVSFRLEGAIDDELIERIEAGLPSGFAYQFKLVRPIKRWFDRTVASSRLEALGMYNAVTQEYSVNYKHNGRLTSSQVLGDRDELEIALTRFDGFVPFTADEVETRKPVRLRVRAVLGSRNLLLLIPTTRHTDWVESERFVLGEAAAETEE